MNNLKKTEWDLGTRLAVERSPVGLISSMDRALGPIIAKSRSSLNFSGSFSTSIQLLSFRLFSLLPPQRLLCVVGRLGRKKGVRHYRRIFSLQALWRFAWGAVSRARREGTRKDMGGRGLKRLTHEQTLSKSLVFAFPGFPRTVSRDK